MQKKFFIAVSLLMVVSMVLAACGQAVTTTVAPVVEATTEAPAAPEATAAPAGPKTITWFIGLGSGGNPEEIKKEKAFQAKFNKEQEGKYILNLAIFQNATAYDVLKTQIASGKSPDIVGPVGVRGLWSFEGAWLDLTDLIAKNNTDLSDFNPALLDFYKLGPMGQIGIPFAVFPSALWYNTKIFDTAGVAYPPHKFEAQYEGKAWDFAALREIAMKMTIDENGNDATVAHCAADAKNKADCFDPTKITQFGYYPQWTDMRGQLTFMGAASFVDANGQAQIPDIWRKALKWYYAGIWTDSFIPSQPYYSSDVFGGGNSFKTGKIAMNPINIWYTCCYEDPANPVAWDVAAIPSFEGNKPVAKLHADTFSILKTAKDPQASFEVLNLLLGQYAADMVDMYGAFPARASLQDTILAKKKETWPNVDWQVFVDALGYPDNPNHESGLPNFLKSTDTYSAFQAKYETKSDLDIDAELDALKTALQAVFDQIKALG